MKMVLLYDNYKGYRDLKTLPTGTARRAYLPRSYVKENRDFPDIRRYLRSTWQPTRLSGIRGNLPVLTARVSRNLLVALYGTVYLKVSNYDDNWDNGDGCGDLNDDIVIMMMMTMMMMMWKLNIKIEVYCCGCYL